MAGFGSFGAGARAQATTMLGAFQNAGVTFAPSREALEANKRGAGIHLRTDLIHLDDEKTDEETTEPKKSGPWPYILGGAMMVAGVGFLAATLSINGRRTSRSASR